MLFLAKKYTFYLHGSKKSCIFAAILCLRRVAHTYAYVYSAPNNMKKTLYILAGCNGAGKTTAALTMLPQIWTCKEFVNADSIAKGISPYNPQSVAFQAGRMMLERIELLLSEGATFSLETTLATRSYARLVDKAHRLGYEVTLLFFWLNSPELAKSRVAQRVAEGGHEIEDKVIERRYRRGISNFFLLFKERVDEWILVDNSVSPRVVIADKVRIYDQERYNKLQAYVG